MVSEGFVNDVRRIIETWDVIEMAIREETVYQYTIPRVEYLIAFLSRKFATEYNEIHELLLEAFLDNYLTTQLKVYMIDDDSPHEIAVALMEAWNEGFKRGGQSFVEETKIRAAELKPPPISAHPIDRKAAGEKVTESSEDKDVDKEDKDVY